MIVQIETLIKKISKRNSICIFKQYADRDTMVLGADTSAMGIV